MKRNAISIDRIASVAMIMVALAVPTMVAAQSFGGSITVFIPQTTFKDQGGSLGFETALETSVGLGDFLSFPVGLAYNQVYGLTAASAKGADPEFTSNGPWYYADSLLPYLLLKASVPIGPVYVEAFGGAGANLIFNLHPVTNQIAEDLADAGAISRAGSGPVGIDSEGLETTTKAGFGWIVGGGTGMTFGQISVGIDVTYRRMKHALSVSGEYFSADGNSGNSGEFNTDTSFVEEGLNLFLEGWAIGIGGRYAM